MKFKKVLAFDDVLLVPQYSQIESRSKVDISNNLTKKIKLNLPIISAPMDTVTESDMAINLNKNFGALGIIHRFNTIDQQVAQILKVDEEKCICGAAIGSSGDYLERTHELVKFCDILCIDVAHAHHLLVLNAIKIIKNRFSWIHLMVGNISTYEAAYDLAKAGADSIKIGIGGGSICSTRIQTGHGYPTFQSVLECSKIKEDFPKIKLIADGGHRTTGDVVKSLAAGADFVVLGSMLAGTSQSPGEIENIGNKMYKTYRGQASEEAQLSWRGSIGSREGISTKIPFKGDVNNILNDIKTNLASGLSYSGATTIKELQEKAQFIQQSNASIIESSTHILNVGGIK